MEKPKKKPKFNPASVQAVKHGIETLVQNYGLETVRWVWNRLSAATRLKSKLLIERKRVDRDLEKIDSKFKF